MRFIRKHLRLRQADLARVLNMANHLVVSQWESREDEPTGMEHDTEVLLRIWMPGQPVSSVRRNGPTKATFAQAISHPHVRIARRPPSEV